MNSYFLNKLVSQAKTSDSLRFRLIEEIWKLEESGFIVKRDKQAKILIIKERGGKS